MAWVIKWDKRALKELKKLDRPIQKKILHFLNTRIAPLENPRVSGKPLSYEKYGLWRYRLDDYRVICKIEDTDIVIIVMQVGHRKNVYIKI